MYAFVARAQDVEARDIAKRRVDVLENDCPRRRRRRTLCPR
jgi:hypothetical protein